MRGKERSFYTPGIKSQYVQESGKVVRGYKGLRKVGRRKKRYRVSSPPWPPVSGGSGEGKKNLTMFKKNLIGE